MFVRILHVTCLWVAAGVVVAQDADKPAGLFLPADCHALVHVQGWPTMQRLHATDPGGRAMRSTAVRTFFDEMKEIVRTALRGAAKLLPEDASLTAQQVDSLPAVVGAFDGSISIGLHLGNKAGGELGGLHAEDVGLVVVLAPSARVATDFDFEPLRKFAIDLMDEIPGMEWRTVRIGELALEVGAMPLGSNARVQVSKPFVHRRQLCWVVSGNIEKWVQRIQQNPMPAPRLRELQQSSLYGMLDPRAAVNLGLSIERWNDPQRDPTDPGDTELAERIFDKLALDSVKGLAMRVHSANAHQYTDFTVMWPGGPRGILRSFVPQRPGVSSLQRFVPFRLQDSMLFRLDYGQLYRDAIGLLEEFPDIGFAKADLQQAFTDKTGLRLYEDLLAHLSGDMMVIDHQIATEDDVWEDEDERTAKFKEKSENKCYVVSLGDSAAFRKNLERVIRKLTLHVGRKKATYRDQRVYTIKHPFLEVLIHYAVCDPCLLIGIGKGGLEGIHAVIDEVVEAAQGKPAARPAAVEARLALEREGYYAFGHQNTREVGVFLREFAEIYAEQMKDGFGEDVFAEDETLRNWETVFKSVAKMAAALSSSVDGYVLSVVRYGKDGMTFREIW